MTTAPSCPDQHASGEAFWVLEGPDGEVKDFGHVANVITEYGDRVYAENGAGIAGAPAVPQTMALGTSSTAPAKTGAGATLVAALAGAAVAVTKLARAGTNARQIEYTGVFGAGVGTTSTPITEAVLTNVATGTAPAVGNTISRLLFSTPVGTKGAQDTLTVVWLHNLGSAAA